MEYITCVISLISNPTYDHSFTIIGFHYIERLIENGKLRFFLEGVTSSVIGLVVVTGLDLTRTYVLLLLIGLIIVEC